MISKKWFNGNNKNLKVMRKKKKTLRVKLHFNHLADCQN